MKSIVLFAAKTVSEISHRRMRVDVDLASDRCCTGIPPISEGERHLLQRYCLNQVSPIWDGDKVIPFEILKGNDSCDNQILPTETKLVQFKQR
jgi:hypothetical protein